MTDDSKRVIPPGSTLGMLGGGQLGRMFAVAAARLGYRVHVYSDHADSPAGRVADRETVGPFDDSVVVDEFARSVDVISYEFENVPAATVVTASQHVPVRPGAALLHVSQHRGREKSGLHELGIPVAPFRIVTDADGLERAIGELGRPSVLKTAEFGYDGKGQIWIRDDGVDLQRIWREIGEREAVLEAAVPFDRELSIIACRGLDGSFAAYDLVENEHVDGILDVSVSPTSNAESLQARGEEIARTIANAFDVVGVFCVEFFEANGDLVVNEIAPRPHNSGHLTIEGHFVSQFEQQVRAICGLPLGSTRRRGHAAMANLVGTSFGDSDVAVENLLAVPDTALHLYGKGIARPGRKMGHVTAIGNSAAEARNLAVEARRLAAARSTAGQPEGSARSESPAANDSTEVDGWKPSDLAEVPNGRES